MKHPINKSIDYNKKISFKDLTPKVITKRTRVNQKRYPTTVLMRYNSYIRRAAKKKIVMELTLVEFTEIVEHSHCVYCGDKATVVDRLNSKIGYTISNSVAACSACNMMKYTVSVDSFLDRVRLIYNHTLFENIKRN